jgi:hypothetical protein
MVCKQDVLILLLGLIDASLPGALSARIYGKFRMPALPFKNVCVDVHNSILVYKKSPSCRHSRSCMNIVSIEESKGTNRA